MKKVISLVLSFCLLFSSISAISVFATNSVDLTVSNVSGAVGDNVAVNVSFGANSNAGGMLFNLNYDNSILEFVSATKGTAMTMSTVAVNHIVAGSQVRLTALDGSTAFNNSGVVMSVVFKIKATSAKETALTISGADIVDFYFNNITPNITNGKVTIVEAPEAPKNFHMKKALTNSINLAWDASSGATGYNIYKNNVKVNTTPITALEYTVSGLTAKTNYNFYIKAVNSSGESASSEVISAKTIANPVNITVSNVRGKAGGTVTIKADISANSNINAGIYDVYYDNDKLELVSGKLNSSIDYAAFDAVQVTGKVRVSFVANDPITAGGNLFELTFKIADGLTEQVIPITLDSVDVIDGEYDDVPANITNGSITVINVIAGDANGDNIITVSDAMVIFQSLSERTTELTGSAKDAADVDGNGIITISDAMKVFQFLSGKITTLEPAATSVSSIILNKTTTTIEKGARETFTASINPVNATNKAVSWTSSNTAVATVANGVVTAKEVGTATITATTVDGNKIARCVVTVINPTISVSSIALNKTTTSIVAGNNEALTVSINPTNASNKAVTWSSSNTAVATVNASGVVTGVAEGSATITAISVEGSKTASCYVTVTAATVNVTSVSLNKSSTTIYTGGTETLVSTILPENATNKDVTWSSSNTAVATVVNGIVTAKSAGTTIITVTTADGNKTANCTVTVANATVAVTGVTINTGEIKMAKGEDGANLVPNVSPSNATNKSVTWSSSDTAVATVNSNGKITALRYGQVTITATTVDGNKTASCTVYVHENRVAFPNGIYSIKKAGTNKAMEVGNSGNTLGSNVNICAANNTSAQKWRLNTINADACMVRFYPQCAPNLMLDVSSTKTDPDFYRTIHIYDASMWQTCEWYITRLYNGSYAIRLNIKDYGCVSAENDSANQDVFFGPFNSTSADVMWTIESVAEAEKTAWVYNVDAGKTLNVRSSPVSGDVIGSFNAGQQIAVIGDVQNGWYRVRGASTWGGTVEGWSSADYITLSQPSEDPIQAKFNELKARFKHDEYWNKYNSSDCSRSGTNPCHCKKNCVGNCYCQCGEFKINGNKIAWQCHGYALKLGYEMFGTNPNDWGREYNLNNVRPGDIIRYLNNGHTVMVTAVSGNTITFTDCNWSGPCKIRWNVDMQKSQFTGLSHVLKHP